MTKPVHPSFWPTLLEARDAAPGVRVFRFCSPKGFSFVPGQFLMFHFADDPKTWRAYSVCSSPVRAAEYFEITVGMVGHFSERLGRLQPRLEGGLVVRGPFGKWIYDGSVPHAVLVSGGTGISPFRAMCLHKVDMGLAGKITLCCSAKAKNGLLFRNEYDDWRKAGIVVNECVTQSAISTAWNGKVGRWTPAELIAAANDKAASFYLCGPNKMVQEMREGLQAQGVPADTIKTEKWGDYADLI
jgi:ferredoxin-NADP reductase